MDKTYLAKELILWASQPIHNELLFDKIFDIHDEVINFIEDKNLNFDGDKELFLMKIMLFIYDNSAS
tara:strand:- start:349 stop:549 length:201 start_codon:yes stop_codon:yes gene_type:complete